MKYIFSSLIVLLFMAIQFYFQSRKGPASNVEKSLAFVWLFIRRLVCFFSSSLCALGVMHLVLLALSGEAEAIHFVGIVLLIAIGYILYHLGMYGTGKDRFDFNEDIPTHAERKKRYGWRW